MHYLDLYAETEAILKAAEERSQSHTPDGSVNYAYVAGVLKAELFGAKLKHAFVTNQIPPNNPP